MVKAVYLPSFVMIVIQDILERNLLWLNIEKATMEYQ